VAQAAAFSKCGNTRCSIELMPKADGRLLFDSENAASHAEIKSTAM